MLSLVLRHRILTTLAISAVVALLWYCIVGCALSFSEKHEWFSSFIEVAIALNMMVSVERIRQEMLVPITRVVEKWSAEAKSKFLDSKRHGIIDDVVSKFSEVYENLLRRLNSEMFWTVRLAQLFAVLSVFVLLSDGCGVRLNVLAMLIMPFLIYHIGVLVELWALFHEFLGILSDVGNKADL